MGSHREIIVTTSAELPNTQEAFTSVCSLKWRGRRLGGGGGGLPLVSLKGSGNPPQEWEKHAGLYRSFSYLPKNHTVDVSEILQFECTKTYNWCRFFFSISSTLGVIPLPRWHHQEDDTTWLGFGDSYINYKPSFAAIFGKGDNPRHTSYGHRG